MTRLGFFQKLIVIFQEDEAAQRNGDILGYFYLKQTYYIFTIPKHGFLLVLYGFKSGLM